MDFIASGRLPYYFFSMLSCNLLSLISFLWKLMTSETIAFIAAVLIIAILTWVLRTLVESDPDPFFLNLTFFAYVGQCIKTSELIRAGCVQRSIIYLILLATFTVLIQVMILRTQKRATLAHYKKLLSESKTDKCSDNEIEHWAVSLLHVSGIDFHPGYYKWLKLIAFVFTEPREKSREDALSILPGGHFNGLTPGQLIVGDEPRMKLWYWYLGICLLSWLLFVVEVIVASKKS